MKYSENGNSKYSISYTYDNNSRLVSEQKTTTGNTLKTNITEYGYDNSGNMLSKAWYNKNTSDKYELNINDVNNDDSVGYEIYTYDALNELTSYTDSKGNEGSYTYIVYLHNIFRQVQVIIQLELLLITGILKIQRIPFIQPCMVMKDLTTIKDNVKE